jgi:chromosome segregation ATPase
MQRLKTTLFTFSLAAFLFACGPNPHEAHIQQIDSMNRQLVNLAAVLENVDSAKIKQRLQQQIENINFLQQEMDSMPRETAFLIDRYGQCKKAYSKWSAKMTSFYEEREMRIAQLNDLKTDMKKKAIDVEKATLYFNDEALQIRLLSELILRMDSSLLSIETQFQETNAQINGLIDSLKNKTNG